MTVNDNKLENYIDALSAISGMDTANDMMLIRKNADGLMYKCSPDNFASGVSGTPLDGWITADAMTYASASTFTVAGDKTATYTAGVKLKLTQTTVKYFYVLSSAYTSSTTVTITGGTDYTLANAAITSPYYSRVQTPAGFPDWFAAGAPTWDTTTIDNGTGGQQPSTPNSFFKINGKTVTHVFQLAATNVVKNGSAAFIAFALPAALPAVNASNYQSFSNLGSAWFAGADLMGTVRKSSTTAIQMYATGSITDNTSLIYTSATYSYIF